MPAWQYGRWLKRANLLIPVLVLNLCVAGRLWSERQPGMVESDSSAAADPAMQGHADPLNAWEGLPVRRITVEGVSLDRLAPLPGSLAQAEGKPLDREAIRRSLRQLFATGLFETIAVEAQGGADGLLLVFRGTPRIFIGKVSVFGAKPSTLNTQLERASQLASGARFTQAKLDQALEQMRAAMAQNGYHEPVITQTLKAHPEDQLVDIAFLVANGPQARIGAVTVTGAPGMSVGEFRRHAHLKAGSRVNSETAEHALVGVLKVYQKQERLEAEIKLESQQYSAETNKSDFRIYANQGPIVKVLVEGSSIDSERVKRMIPIFEEGSVDDDLLNEGNRRLRDYYQRQGYFDVKVEHERQSATADRVTILYKVKLGVRRRVEQVTVKGNHYFDSATLKDLLSVHAADQLDHHGAYSQALVNADINALQAVYRNNGFSQVKVTPETSIDVVTAENTSVSSDLSSAQRRKIAPLAVVYRIDEGQQLRVGAVRLEGNDHLDAAKLTPLMNTITGQLLSPANLAGDRDTLLTEYLSRGYDQARVEVAQRVDAAGPNRVDVIFHITEGRQIFVRKVLLTGLHYT
ncbi:MAG TPA: POTRA domain-containing protein, partial [Terracidiphilus sp.]